ncbi:MAG: hypothetical protein WCG01_04045 [bacterium]
MNLDITLNLDPWYGFMALPADEMLLRMMLLVGWLPIAFIFMWGFWQLWQDYIGGQWGAKQKYIFLAIDVPKGNEQSPKAVENLLTYFAGAHSNPNLIEVYWDGVGQKTFSLEIASIDGYTQFIIRANADFRSLVETAVYSTYPDAEITEINDYTKGYPRTFPNDEYDVWAAEFVLANPEKLLPIKCYKEFEHTFGKPETQFRDPIASLMDLCSSLRPGEQLWYQIIIVPIDQGKRFSGGGAKAIGKIFGDKPKSSPHWMSGIADEVAGWMAALTGIDLRGAPAAEKKPETALKMMDLRPEQKKQVEGIQEKISKQGFEFKMRLVYMARRDVINKPKVANGFVGFIKQFGANDLNAFKPHSKTVTSTSYFRKASRLNYRKNNIVGAYMDRSGWVGSERGLLNIEELATIWHFPIEASVRAPLIQKTSGRKAEPPITLPIGDDVSSRNDLFDEIFVDYNLPEKKSAEQVKNTTDDIFSMDSELKTESVNNKAENRPSGEAPDNLPFV